MNVPEILTLLKEYGFGGVLTALIMYLMIKAYNKLIPLIAKLINSGTAYLTTCTIEVKGINSKLDEHKEVLGHINNGREAALRMIEAGFDLLSPEQQRQVRDKLDEAREILLKGS